jgi:uncharacterized Tic20 family protein
MEAKSTEVPSTNPPKSSNTGYAACLHLSVFLSLFLPILGIVAPIIMWVLKKDDPFVDKQGREAIRFQIVMWLWAIVFLIGLFIAAPFAMGAGFAASAGVSDPSFAMGGSAVMLLLFFLTAFLLLMQSLLLLVYPIVAAIRAGSGEPHAFRWVFSPRREAWVKFKKARNS